MNEIEEQKKYIYKVKQMQLNKEKKYYILTMGCQLNENDSEKLSGMIEEMGYRETNKIEESDLILLNTCCVRENAEDKLFGKLGEAKKQKQQRNVIIAVGGCMMQEPHMVEKIHKSYSFCDIIFGTHTLHKFPQDLYEVLERQKKIEDILKIDGKVYEGIPIQRKDPIKASVTIMNGCNNFCSYCIVPYVRGRERSRKPEAILEEIEQLAKQGYQEITLLGQNVNSYQGGENYGFSDLLKQVNQVPQIQRIRFISPHPKDFTQDVIEAIAQCDKVCKLIHLPLQSGSSQILKKMNRRYTTEQYLQLVEKMRQRIPEIEFSTDIIVGFPGETQEDFQETLEVVKKVQFEQVYMFIYSRRVGTPADTMTEQIPEEIKHKRFEELKKLVEEQIQQNNKKYQNTIQTILVEGKSKNNPELLTGRTQMNKVVVFKGDNSLVGKVIPVKLVEDCLWYFKAELQ